MAEEEVVAAPSPEPSDHKRKLEDLEPELEGRELPTVDPNANLNINSISELVKKEEEAVNGGDSDESEAKRPRLDDKPDGLATENGYKEEEKLDEPNEEVTKRQSVENNIEAEDTQEQAENVQETTKDEEAATIDDQLQPCDENPQLENTVEEPSKGEFKEPEKQIQEVTEESVSQQHDVSFVEQQPESEPQTTSRKIEVPNAKVGVLIGKGGDTIRYLQLNSGARIQITRDADADPHAPTRPVELIGSLENINKAERLIKDVITEADAGGSPALVARGFNNVQSSGAAEQIEIQVPNEKVGLIIGKGGETIKNLQTRSGTRIQLIPQRPSEGDQSRERTVRVTGEKKQIEMAREMIKEVMNQQVRPSYNQQQGSRPRGPPGSQWGPQGPRPSHPSGYSYPQRGPPYPPHNPPQQMHSAYGNYPPQQMDPRTNFNGDQRPPPSTMQGPPPQGGNGGYNYYGGQGGPTPPSNSIYSHGPGPTPAPTAGPPHANYNYGQPQGQDYGQAAPYSQTAPPQSYGHAPQQNPYGGHTATQQSAYPQGGYGPQDPYGKPPHTQSYAPTRANQPGDIPYQGPPPSTQSYGPNVPTQQPYPYASTGYGYQGGQPGYSQQAPVYAQAGPTGGYGQYPSSQPGYEQPAPNNVGYGYQGSADPAYGAGQGYGAPPTGQPAYSQPAPVQPGYDQSVQQPGNY